MAAVAAAETKTPSLHLQDCTYTSCYCEENVYMLLRRLQEQQQPGSTLFTLLISNPQETVPFWYQKASTHPDGFVIWDYHVSSRSNRSLNCLNGSPLVSD
jgi:hypothetical protein